MMTLQVLSKANFALCLRLIS